MALVDATLISGPAGIQHGIRLARDGRPHHIAQPQRDAALFPGQPQCRKRIGRFPGLADGKHGFPLLQQRITVTKLGGYFHGNGHAAESFQKTGSPQSGVK